MGKYIIQLTEKARKDFIQHKRSGNKASNKKLIKILKELQEHPYLGTGSPEPLKHQLSGFWSRRINQKDRLIYKVKDKIVTVDIISAMGHYGDK